jgi:hypothetical protein
LIKTELKKIEVTHPTKSGEVKNGVKTRKKEKHLVSKNRLILFSFPLSSAALSVVPFHRAAR